MELHIVFSYSSYSFKGSFNKVYCKAFLVFLKSNLKQMKTRFNHILFLLSVVLLISCGSANEKVIITKKIQYDVAIKNVQPDYDPWIENINHQQRIDFVKNLIYTAYDGKVKAYDYFNKELSLEELKKIGVDTLYTTLTRNDPPYEEFDTVIVKKFRFEDINKIRFLEEWKMDTNQFVFEKKVIGIAPIIDKFDQEGNFLGKQPLFWIYPKGK